MTPQSEPLELVNLEAQGGLPSVAPQESTSSGLTSGVTSSVTLSATSSAASSATSGAAQLARNLAWIPGQQESRQFRDRCEALTRNFRPLLASFESRPPLSASEDFLRLRENNFLLAGELRQTCATFQSPHKLPQVRTSAGEVIPRVSALAGDYLAAGDNTFTVESFGAYIRAFQQVTVLRVAELWMLIPVMKLVLLERIAGQGLRMLENPSGSPSLHACISSLKEIKQASWEEAIEPLILFDGVLREDPAGAYSGMDYETRELYRKNLVAIADRCDCSEMKVAGEVLALSREAIDHFNRGASSSVRSADDVRTMMRHSHVGFYLIAEGRPLLEERVDYDPPPPQRLRTFLLRHPDEFYLPGIAALTFAIVTAVVLLLTPPSTALGLVLLSILAVFLPASQSAVQIMNYLATMLLPAQILPKLDFSAGLPLDCVTLVAVPTMLMNEKQVHKLAEDLEVRYLGNQDRNLHFALLSDLPDSPYEAREDQQPLVDLAEDLIKKLNAKYANSGAGLFYLFHRHRVYNPRERIWMGWERKRGKLMDLNNLLRGGFDSFPVKIGDLAVLPSIRYIITLDSDTELPRGSAARMAGTLAHPLNQAIIDPEKGIVVAGYGILEPRVGVSVQSSARSRLAAIYSGQTGFDIYTHATSDVYQDLYGEGIFVGKGIYEVETLQRVLHRRFPRNALLSHDLIEGAYARAGLVSDIEIIEDYPSHYSAHNRRKHRWLRGDWQIAGWLLPMVPEESGDRVPNPLSVISRWKILDNLRRSLVEPAIFLLFVLGWLCLPAHAASWTAATILILFLPALCQVAVDLAQAAANGRTSQVRDAGEGFLNACIANVLTITFLAHQALLSLDAVVRTMVRRLITRQRMLQWETAAEAELAGDQRTTLDIYLNWTPALSLSVFLLLLLRPGALWSALPILLLWAVSKPVSLWLNRPPREHRKQTFAKDHALLRTAALRTWRYFAELSTEEHHWLIPDNIRQHDGKVAARVSTTNLGLLLNARQAANTFGYITVPDFCRQTLRTLETLGRLQRHHGHLLNWYDTQTLKALTPAVISSVDNGNLIASLWTLEQGSLDLLRQPLFPSNLAQGILDHCAILTDLGVFPKRDFPSVEKNLSRETWLQHVLESGGQLFDGALSNGALSNDRKVAPEKAENSDANWFREQLAERIRQIEFAVITYTPWLSPKYFEVMKEMASKKVVSKEAISAIPIADADRFSGPPILEIPSFISALSAELKLRLDPSASSSANNLLRELLTLLPQARSNALRLIEDLENIAGQSSALADEMDLSVLLNPNRKLLSVAFELDKEQNHPACYDLLASEARIAYFVAIAKSEISQESWFQLGRPPIAEQGITGLLSWTGTMFEYLMPALWMRMYPNTLLERAAEVAILKQKAYAAERGVPWGISESASSKLDDAGNYYYFAFGVPDLAISKPEQDGPVISPYSTFLALNTDPEAALRNLRNMQRKNYLGTYGFYESLDFSAARQSRSRAPEVVRCWMAHHQGMSLLAIANFLHDNVVQNWFHGHPRVQATELLLQEKPAARVA